MGLDARQALLRLVQAAPGFLDRHVEVLVADDVAAAEEVMVLDAVALHLALQDAQRFGVVVDALDDRRLVLDVQVVALADLLHRAARRRHPLQAAARVVDVVAVFVLAQELVRVVEVDDDADVDVGPVGVEAVEHFEKVLIETIRVEREFLRADADLLDAVLGQGRQPLRDVAVAQHHRVAAGQQDLAQFLAARDRVAAAVVGDQAVVLDDVVDHLADLRQALLGDRAVVASDFLARDQFLAVAEAAVGGAGRGDVGEADLVLVQQALDRAVVHLVARVLGAGEVGGLARVGLDQHLQRQAVLRQFEVVAGHLDRHALLDVARRAGQRRQRLQFVVAVEALHLVRHGAVDELADAGDDLAVVLGVLHRFKEGQFFCARLVLGRFQHGVLR